MIKLPGVTGIWKQLNLGDIFGNIWSSFNLDLTSKQGKVQIATRFMINTSSDTGLTGANGDANLSVPIALVQENSGYWYALTGSGGSGKVFVGTQVPNGAFAIDTAIPTPSITANRADMVYFNSLLYVVNNDIQKLALNRGSWSTITTSSTSNGPACVFGQRLYFIDTQSHVIASMTTADVVHKTPGTTNDGCITLLGYDASWVTCMRGNSSSIFIGTLADNPSQMAKVYKWDGVSNSVLVPIPIPSCAVFAMTIKDGAPWIMDANGILRAYNGAVFIEKAYLPIRDGKSLKYSVGTPTARYIHPNGMITRGNSIFCLINGTNADNAGFNEEAVQSGVWEFTETNGFVHRGGMSLWVALTTTTATDFGSAKISAVGALADAKTVDTTSTTNGDLMVGATYLKDATTTKNAIFYNDRNNLIQKAGYLVTQKLFSPNILESWIKLTIRLRKFLSATDKLVVKYRTVEQEYTELTLTWTSTTTFTTTDTSFANFVVGDEAEVINGVGAGRLSHITVISYSAPTYTVTVDETYTGATGTAKARIQSWKKLGTFADQTKGEYFPPMLSVPKSSWIQFKLWFVSTGRNEMHDIELENAKHE